MKYLFLIVGVGGTGGAVARDLPKLLVGSQNKMILIDGDTVEKRNIIRQPYQIQDEGYNKARILARKINSLYKVDCSAFDDYIVKAELDYLIKKNEEYLPVIIGCVDNDATRILLEDTFLKHKNIIYLDGANSEYEGNIYVSKKNNDIKFGPIRSEVYKLEKDRNPGIMSCEEQISKGSTQFLITNNKVASVILEHIHCILTEQELNVGVTVIERFKTVHY